MDSLCTVVQDQQRSKEMQIQKATSRKEEAVKAAGSLKGQVKTLTKEKSNLKEQLEVGVPLHNFFHTICQDSTATWEE